MAHPGSLIENLDKLIAQMDDHIIITEGVREKLELSSLGDFMAIFSTCINRNMEAIKELAQYIRADRITQLEASRLHEQNKAELKDAGDNRESVGASTEGG